MVTAKDTERLLTLGDILREPGFESYTRRQVEYVLQDFRPTGRAGIIRLFSESQLPLIQSALRRTARRAL